MRRRFVSVQTEFFKMQSLNAKIAFRNIVIVIKTKNIDLIGLIEEKLWQS